MKGMTLPKLLFIPLFAGTLLLIGFLLGARWGSLLLDANLPISLSPVPTPKPELPYLKYRFQALKKYDFQPSELFIHREIESGAGFTGYQFTFETTGRVMSGQINIPDTATASGVRALPVIIMNRGWAPQATYASGTGTRPAARVFARNGFVTIALDFFGYGESAPEVSDAWEARFIKPINVIELLRTIQTKQSLRVAADAPATLLPLTQLQLDPNRIGFWGHSNGGHITISVLEILSEPIPATVWAPVTAPFPYSLLFFTDEERDEGKGFRRWLADFEKEYDVFEFSITRHLTDLTGPLQIQHGTADDAALVDWSDAFSDRIDAENARRAAVLQEIESAETATEAAALRATVPTAALLEPIPFTYLRYPGVNHNMQPRWDDAVLADLRFFEQHL
jgi:pimeloyl-ACP methyl ester carboxylesterase